MLGGIWGGTPNGEMSMECDTRPQFVTEEMSWQSKELISALCLLQGKGRGVFDGGPRAGRQTQSNLNAGIYPPLYEGQRNPPHGHRVQFPYILVQTG